MKDIIKPIIQFVVGIMLLPTAGSVVAYVSSQPNLSSIFGLTLILSASIVVIAMGIMYKSVKEFF